MPFLGGLVGGLSPRSEGLSCLVDEVDERCFEAAVRLAGWVRCSFVRQGQCAGNELGSCSTHLSRHGVRSERRRTELISSACSSSGAGRELERLNLRCHPLWRGLLGSAELAQLSTKPDRLASPAALACSPSKAPSSPSRFQLGLSRYAVPLRRVYCALSSSPGPQESLP